MSEPIDVVYEVAKRSWDQAELDFWGTPEQCRPFEPHQPDDENGEPGCKGWLQTVANVVHHLETLVNEREGNNA